MVTAAEPDRSAMLDLIAAETLDALERIAAAAAAKPQAIAVNASSFASLNAFTGARSIARLEQAQRENATGYRLSAPR